MLFAIATTSDHAAFVMADHQLEKQNLGVGPLRDPQPSQFIVAGHAMHQQRTSFHPALHVRHSMEHGAVWITYRPDLPPDQGQSLKSTASDDFMLLSPYPGLASPVVASAWNHQIRLDGAGDSRLRPFIDRYKSNPATTPEFGAPCAGGTSATAAADTLRTPQRDMSR